jgi:glutathione-regulated potassium-efflux system ancillary protein KefG
MKILILFAHPALQKSKVNQQLIKSAYDTNGVQVNDLYERYPDFNIDIKAEQNLLIEHDVIVFQHPFYWYSSPAILKEWQDLVLEHNFAYGEKGKALTGKYLCSVISTGGNKASYQSDGYNRFQMMELLAPFRQTAFLCGMTYLPPFLVQGTHALTNGTEIRAYGEQYKKLLENLRDEKINFDDIRDLDSINSIL